MKNQSQILFVEAYDEWSTDHCTIDLNYEVQWLIKQQVLQYSDYVRWLCTE